MVILLCDQSERVHKAQGGYLNLHGAFACKTTDYEAGVMVHLGYKSATVALAFGIESDSQTTRYRR